MISTMVKGQESGSGNKSFFDRFIVGKTLASDIDQTRIVWDDIDDERFVSLGLSFGEYTLTEDECKDLGHTPELVKFLFYKKDGKDVLGEIRMFNSFPLKITKDYDTDKRNKNHLLIKTRNITNSLVDNIQQRGGDITKSIYLTRSEGGDSTLFSKYTIWQTSTYNARMDILYSDFSLLQKYRDMEWSWTEGGELLTNYSLDVTSIELYRALVKEVPQAVNSFYELLALDDMSDYIDEEANQALDKILANAANNYMEDIPLKKELWNDPTYIPEGLSVISLEDLEAYSWEPVLIAGKEIKGYRPEQMLFINFSFKDETDDNSSFFHIEGTQWGAWRYFKTKNHDASGSSRIDIEIRPLEVSMVDDSGVYDILEILEKYLDMGRDSYSLFQDDDSNLVFVNRENEGHRAIFRRVNKK